MFKIGGIHVNNLEAKKTKVIMTETNLTRLNKKINNVGIIVSRKISR